MIGLLVPVVLGLVVSAPQASACPPCDLTAEVEVVLGRDEGPGILGNPGPTLQMRDGDWLVYDYMNEGQPLRFGPDGSPKGATAVRGQGPREFGRIWSMHRGPGDSIYVVDSGNARLGIRDPNFRPVRTWRPNGYLNQIVVLRDGVVTTTQGNWGESPVVFIEWAGRQTALVTAPSKTRREAPRAWWRSIATASDSSVWSADLLRYRVEERTMSGTLLRSIEREEPWFEPQTGFGAVAGQEPRPGLLAIDQSEDGLLWVMVSVVDEDWGAAAEPGKDLYGREASVLHDLSLYYDTIIQVIRLSDERMVATLRMDQRLIGFAAHGLVYGDTETEMGSPTRTMWRLRLAR
jgi:hypothetical protein